MYLRQTTFTYDTTAEQTQTDYNSWINTTPQGAREACSAGRSVEEERRKLPSATTTITHTFPSRTHTNPAPSETVLCVQTVLCTICSSWRGSGSCVSWAYTWWGSASPAWEWSAHRSAPLRRSPQSRRSFLPLLAAGTGHLQWPTGVPGGEVMAMLLSEQAHFRGCCYNCLN